MRERPDGAELLDLAGELLRERLLPALPAESRHDALMIGNAMAIAARQLRAGDTSARREGAALARLLGASPGDDVAHEDRLLELNAELARRIRTAGPDALAPLRDHLRCEAVERVRESNPAYLDSDDAG